MRPAMSLARWLLAVWAETPARAASSPAGRASPPASARHMAAREGSAMRFATNAMFGSVMVAPSGFDAFSLAPQVANMFHDTPNPHAHHPQSLAKGKLESLPRILFV